MKQILKSGHRIVALTLLLAMTLIAFTGCGVKKNTQASTPSAPGLPDTPLHKLASAVFDIAAGLSAGERELEIVTDAGLIGTDEATIAAKAINAANECNRTFDARLKTQSAVNSDNKQKVLAWSQDLTTCLNGALNDNVLGFKNATAKQKVQEAFGLINIALGQIVGALSQIPDVPSQRKTLTVPAQQTKNFSTTEENLHGKYATGDRIYRTGTSDRRRIGDSSEYAERGEGGDTACRENSSGSEPTPGRTARRRNACGRRIALSSRANWSGHCLQAESVSAATPGEGRREASELGVST